MPLDISRRDVVAVGIGAILVIGLQVWILERESRQMSRALDRDREVSDAVGVELSRRGFRQTRP